MKVEAVKNKTIPAKRPEVTVETVLVAHKALAGAKLSKLEYNDLKKVSKAIRALKHAAKDYDELMEIGLQGLKDKEWEKDEKLRERFTELTPDQQYKINKSTEEFNRKLIKLRRDENEKAAELRDYERISEDALEKLLEGNPDLTGEEIVAIQDVLLA